MENMRKWSLRTNGFLAVVALALLAIGAAILVSPAPAQAEESEARELVVAQVDSSVGYAFIAAAIAVGLSCIAAGIAVAAVGAAAMGAVAERPELMGRSIIFVGLAEGIAIYGLIVAIIMLGKI